MSAGKADLLIEQGATFERKLVFKDDLGILLDLTGNVFSGQIRKKTDDPIILAQFSFVIANQITNKGEVTIKLTDAQTSAIPVSPQKFADRKIDKYTYDIERAFGLQKNRVIEGFALISPEATK